MRALFTFLHFSYLCPEPDPDGSERLKRPVRENQADSRQRRWSQAQVENHKGLFGSRLERNPYHVSLLDLGLERTRFHVNLFRSRLE